MKYKLHSLTGYFRKQQGHSNITKGEIITRNNNKKRAEKYYIIKPLNLSDLSAKFIVAFSIWRLSMRLYFGSPKSSD